MKKVLISLICFAILAALYACSNVGNNDLKISSAASGGAAAKQDS